MILFLILLTNKIFTQNRQFHKYGLNNKNFFPKYYSYFLDTRFNQAILL